MIPGLPLAPEGALFLLILALFVRSLLGAHAPCGVRSWAAPGAFAVLVIAAVGLVFPDRVFNATFTVDALSQFFKFCVALGFFFVVLNALRQGTPEEEKQPDYFLFMAFSAWGLMILSSATELVSMYLALELSSYSLYILIPLRGRDQGAAEAGAKYILFGAAATAISLFGLAFIISGQHSTVIAELASRDWSFAGAPQAVLGLCLFLGGMFYKLALFPFHFWCPDVYQGASNETAAYVATLPKLGAVVMLIRLAVFLKPGLEATTLLAVLGLFSMTFGNLCALAQKDVKRLLGFSAVAHAGYIMLGLVTGTPEGLAAAAFYSLAYVLMNLLCFWVLGRVSMDGRNLSLRDLNGLYKRAPVLAFALAIGAFALVGLPPTAGFMGKLFLLSSAWGHGYDWLIIAMVLNSALAIYYYLSLVRHAYTEEEAPASAVDASCFASAGALVLAALVLLLGILPAPAFDYALRATGNLL